MRIVLQRVKYASVDVDGKRISHIGPGILILLGIGKDDTRKEADYLIRKALELRIFEDENGKMNRSVSELGYEVMVVSQFTLYGNCSKGRRPGFSDAMPPQDAHALYEYFAESMRAQNIPVQTGIFGAHMEISLLNDGPVTFIIESN